MPLQLPVLDDRNFEQLLLEAKRRIPVHVPEWTNFDVESDPGITIVELFAFLTESLLYRADRIPERNRLKFLQLLDVPLQPAAAAQGIVVIRNERGPIAPLPLEDGIVVAAGNVNFLTLDAVNVLPVEAAAFYKRKISKDDPRYEEFNAKYQAIKDAALSLLEGEDAEGNAFAATTATGIQLDFYETAQMVAPTASAPNPVLDLATDETIDHAVYLALLAPKNVEPETVREAVANQTISIGIVPALLENVPPLMPQQRITARQQLPQLVFEMPDATSTGTPRYERLRVLQQPDVLNEVGIVQLVLPGKEKLSTWEFDEPLEEGTGDFPPRIEDDDVRKRLVTWIRARQPGANNGSGAGNQGDAVTGAQLGATTGATAVASRRPAVSTQANQSGTLNARLTWMGANVTRIRQAIPVFNELLGTANGEPDQTMTLANTPVIADTVYLEVEDINRVPRLWRQTDDLLSASDGDELFSIDPESGRIRFGDGLRGARPPRGSRIRASYRYGGGTQGNVGIGVVKSSPEVRLQGGYKIENPIATWGGDTGETIEEGERNIPLYLRHRDRLVTAQDFEDITRRTAGVDVGRVEVLPLFHPDRGQSNAAGIVTLMVIPATDTVRPLWPSPNRLFLKTVCDYLDSRRLVTTEVYVRGPVYVPVFLSVGIEVRGGYFRDQVIQDVAARLEEYLSALAPGGPDEEGWPLNKLLLKKDLEAVVTRVAGVEFVVSMELGVGSGIDVENRRLTGLQLPRLDLLSVREGTAESLESLLGTTTETPSEPTLVPVPVTKSKC